MSSATNFNRFYEAWFDQLNQLVHQLRGAPKPPTSQDELTNLAQLVHKFMSHYVEYYRVKSMATQGDVLSIFASPWASSMERSLHWIAGWRPTTLFHLVYTESSVSFESRIVDILRGFRTGDLGDLSPNQFRRVSELQCETVKEENEITNELSDWQDSAIELMRCCSSDLDPNVGRLVRVVQKADDLRLRTVRNVVELLSPQQAAEFLTAAAELQFGIRGWGKDHDQQRHGRRFN